MNIPAELKYTEEHEWIRLEGEDIAYIGITDFAQSELGDLVYVEISTVGETVGANDVFGTVEAVKTTSDLFMPVDGEVLEANPTIDGDQDDNPSVINDDPYGEGWIIKIKLSNPADLDGLMDAEKYKAHIA